MTRLTCSAIASAAFYTALIAPDGVLVDREGAAAVLELVLHLDRLRRELAELADGHESRVELVRERTGKDEAARRLVVLGIDAKTAGPEVVADLQKQLQSTPRDPIALERLGAIQERDGAFDKAAETFQSALKYNPQDSAFRQDGYDMHLREAWSLTDGSEFRRYFPADAKLDGRSVRIQASIRREAKEH